MCQNLLFSLSVFISTLKVLVKHGVEGTGLDLLQLIQDAKKSVRAIHDIKIDFNSNLHDSLRTKGYQVHNTNKLILVPIVTNDPNLTIKASVYPKSVQLDIGCSSSPISYNMAGASKLADILDFVHNYLCSISGHKAEIPRIGTWMITHYHHNKDSKNTYDGERFHITCEEALGSFTRIYDKEINGSRVIRLEEIKTPRIAVADELKIMQEAQF